MSGLVTGLSIGGAIAGAIGGPGYVILEGLSHIWGGGAPDRSMPAWAVGGAVVGAAILGGGGWVYENGLGGIFDRSSSPAPVSTTAPANTDCVKSAPQGYSITLNKDGTCTYKPD